MTYSPISDVFCDALTVTYPRDALIVSQIHNFVIHNGGIVSTRNPTGSTDYYSLGNGYCRLSQKGPLVSVNFSGSCLAYFRERKAFRDLLELLGSETHNVTRLDAALDLSADYPLFRGHLRSLYPEGYVSLSRKRVKVREFLETRSDGLETGTYYVGKRGNTRFLRIYDKQNEALLRRATVLPPTTRIEVEVGRKYGATLRDAWEPAPLFWEEVPREILPRPHGVPSRIVMPLEAWTIQKDTRPLPDLLKRGVERSGELETLYRLSRGMGPNGPDYLASLVQGHITRKQHHDFPADRIPPMGQSVSQS